MWRTTEQSPCFLCTYILSIISYPDRASKKTSFWLWVIPNKELSAIKRAVVYLAMCSLILSAIYCMLRGFLHSWATFFFFFPSYFNVVLCGFCENVAFRCGEVLLFLCLSFDFKIYIQHRYYYSFFFFLLILFLFLNFLLFWSFGSKRVAEKPICSLLRIPEFSRLRQWFLKRYLRGEVQQVFFFLLFSFFV